MSIREVKDKDRMPIDGALNYAVYMLDPTGKVVSWSAGAERLKGFTADQIVGRNFSCLFRPEDVTRGRPEQILRLAAESGQYKESGVRVRRDGSQFMASAIFTALRDPAGTMLGFCEISQDLSESRESEMRYRGLLEAAPDAMIVVDQGGEILLLNVQAERQFGYHRDELVGQKVTNIIPEGFAERLIADGTRSADEVLSQQMGTGIELYGLRSDNTRFPIEIMLSPLKSAEGILVTAAIRDITARKNAEMHIAQMEGRYRGLLEAAPDAMVVVNRAGEIVLLNVQAEKQFGYLRDELLGQAVNNIIPEGFAERLISDALRSREDALAQQMGTGIELKGRRKDGSEFPIEIMLSPLKSPEGTLVTAAIRDITVRKESEVRLAQIEMTYRAERERIQEARHEEARLQLKRQEEAREEKARLQDRFLSHVSHELRTPLTAIYFFTTNMLDGIFGDLNSEQHQHIELILGNIIQLKNMVSDLLDITRIDTHKLSIEFQAVDPAKLIRDVVSTCSTTAAAKSIGLTSVIEQALPLVWADASRIRQVLINLVDNGIKFTQKNGVVTVGSSPCSEDGDFLCLSVKDTGCGISPDNRESIFARLAQVKGSEETSRAGLGLGLFISRELVLRHGGRIWVESELGQGSSFYFTLPQFSLTKLLTPIFAELNLDTGSVTLIAVDVSYPDGIVRMGIAPGIRRTLERCIHPGMDVLLPAMNGPEASEALFIVACADRRGSAVITSRINKELESFIGASGAKPLISSTTVMVPKGRPSEEQVSTVMKRIKRLIETHLAGKGMSKGTK